MTLRDKCTAIYRRTARILGAIVRNAPTLVARAIGPLQRMYYFSNRRFSQEERERLYILDVGGRGRNTYPFMHGWGGKVRTWNVNLFVEADIKDDARTLATISEESADGIYSSHLIEHLWWWEAEQVLVNWFKKLTPGGRLEIRCPDMSVLLSSLLVDRKPHRYWEDLTLHNVYGAASKPWHVHYKVDGQVHRNLLTAKRLIRLLEGVGFGRVRRIHYGRKYKDYWPYDLSYHRYFGKKVKDLVVEAYRPERTSQSLFISHHDSAKEVQKRLRGAEWGMLSQNGEDGVIDQIFKYIGVTTRYFVEIGIAPPWGRVSEELEGNTVLLRKLGWEGLWVDKCTEHAQVVNSAVTAEDVDALLRHHSVPENCDLLSIDVDGNDFWLWSAIRAAKPRVVVIEYNAALGSKESKTIEYDPDYQSQGTNYFGASLEALRRLGSSKGYSLVYCESEGVNAFFVRKDFLVAENELRASETYRRPKYPPYKDGVGRWMHIDESGEQSGSARP